MILHELYFDSLGGAGADPARRPQMPASSRISAVWMPGATEFAAMGKAQGGGSGWILLAWSRATAGCVNTWAADHAHNLAGAIPLIALDMYEHSYHMDFGAKAARLCRRLHAEPFLDRRHSGLRQLET